ncbi:MAG: lipoate--protein ligase family protein [Cyanobacteriota bacterium]
MSSDPGSPIAAAGEARWIPPLTLGGAWQMAIDEWLLDTAPTPVLRLYEWQRPTLSLGHHQRQLDPQWLPLLQQGGLDLVRRPSGGRAVLHAGCLTYALIWPDPPQRRQEAYLQACRWLQEAFAVLDLPLAFGRERASLDHSSCFALSTNADLVHSHGAKRIGSAQLWRGGRLLQHGTILLRPPSQLWQALFGASPPDLPPLGLEGEALVRLLRRMGELHLPFARPGMAWSNQPLEDREWEAIAARLDRYRPAGLPPVTPASC